VLGPLLFILFIRDLPNIFNIDFQAKLFADDLKTYCKPDYFPDLCRTQVAIDSLVHWSNVYQLSIVVSKFGCLRVHNDPVLSDEGELHFVGNPFRVLHETVDLGVAIDNKLQFNIHIDEVIFKAKRRIYLLFKSFTSINIYLFYFCVQNLCNANP